MNNGELFELAREYRNAHEELRKFEAAWASEVLPPSGTIVRLNAKQKVRVDRFDSLRLVGNQYVEFRASSRLLRPDGLPSERPYLLSHYLRRSNPYKENNEPNLSQWRRYRALVDCLKTVERNCLAQALPPIGTDTVSQEGVRLEVRSHDRCVLSYEYLLVIGSAYRVKGVKRRRITGRCEIEVEIPMPPPASSQVKIPESRSSSQVVSRRHLLSGTECSTFSATTSAMGLPTCNHANVSLDATYRYSDVFREGGRFGSHPGHDSFDEESGA